MEIKTVLKNYINSETKLLWDKIMLKLTPLQINELSEEYDLELEHVAYNIVTHIDEGIDDLIFTMNDFMEDKFEEWERVDCRFTPELSNDDMPDISYKFDDGPDVEDELVVEDEPAKEIKWKSDINQDFKY